jgi:putative protease
MAFSRGLSTGWLSGINNQKLVHARFGKKRGVFLGSVEAVADGKVALRLSAPLQAGDGVVFDAGHPELEEEGGRVYAVDVKGPLSWLSFGHGTIDWRNVHIGDKLWKTSDPDLQRQLRRTFAADQPNFQRPLRFEVSGAAGEPLRLKARDEANREVTVLSSLPLVEAHQQPLTDERLTSQLGRLGGSSFRLAQLVNRLQGEVILPMSELNRLRRQVVEQLVTLRAELSPWQLAPPGNFCHLLQPQPRAGEETLSAERPQLILLVRSMVQLQAALELNIGTIYCEFEDPKKYKEAVNLYRAARPQKAPDGGGLFLAPPRISKPGEDWILRQVAAAEPDGILVRNYDHLERWAQKDSALRCVGDYSLNVANGLAAEYLLERHNLERLTASYDLNFEQLEALLRSAPAGWFEVTLHQHMPLFHMEHCVFCAFLSQGTDYTNCGRPCDHHVVRLRDRVGAEHWLKADAGCRNTVFNARAQTGAEYASRLAALGLRRFRIELMDEDHDQVSKLVSMYQALLEDRLSARQLWQELKLHHQLGVTRGSF